MKVVHIIARDTGGAARAAFRIDKALKSIGVESSVLVLHKSQDNKNVLQVIKSNKLWDCFRAIRKITMRHSNKYNLVGRFYEGEIGLPISRIPEIKNTDIIHLHWINDGMVTINELERLSKLGKKIIWTMHDMFPFTAGCYYDDNCGKYEHGCKDCPLTTDKNMQENIEELYAAKQKVYQTIDISFVGCSEWITECAKKSVLTQGKKVCTIPNPIEFDVFDIKEKETSLMEFSIQTHKKIILFGAMSSDSDPRKGFKYLKDSLQYLDSEKFLLVVFGNKNIPEIDTRFESVSVGTINSDTELAKLYSLADVFVAPSTQENLSNAVMESLACGTPVVAFNVGGMKDMISHLETGYLAEYKNAKDLARGIEYVSLVSNISRTTVRNSVINKFSFEIVGNKYKELYLK